MSLGVEGDGADGCDDDHHTQCDWHKEHDDVLVSIEQRLLRDLLILINSIRRRLLWTGLVNIVSAYVAHWPTKRSLDNNITRHQLFLHNHFSKFSWSTLDEGI